MTFPDDTPDESAICPYLGLVDDAESHATYATEAHRCYRLATPTRIASQHQENFCLGANHPNCPVYQGEGVEATTTTPARSGPPPLEPLEPQPPQWSGPAAAEPERPEPSRPPRRQQEQTQPFGTPAPGGRPRAPRRPSTGRVGQRSGGISMPVATIGLFALAIVVVVIAFIINQQLGDDGEPLSPADEFATNQALTQQAGGGETQTPEPGETETPQTGETPTSEPTEDGEETPTPPNGNGQVHIVEPGDTCGAIAAQYGVTLQDFLDANNLTEEDCLAIQPGQELIIP